MIHILLIDDHIVVREGVTALLSSMSGMRVVGQAGTAKEAVDLARDKHPDIVLLDFRLPDGHGLEVSRKLLRYLPDLKIISFTAMANDLLITLLLKVGARGYVHKENSAAELERAIRKVHSGQCYLSPDVANRLALNKATRSSHTPFDDLSVREMEVLLMLAEGWNPKEIAKALFISTKTVNSYRYRAFEKLQVKNDIGLIKLAIQYGVIEVDLLPMSLGRFKTVVREDPCVLE